MSDGMNGESPTCPITGESETGELEAVPLSAIPGAPSVPHDTFHLFHFHESCSLADLREWVENREFDDKEQDDE